jgi:TolB-like protein/DNA-binding winged helix-turn-helix (wHTH) protein
MNAIGPADSERVRLGAEEGAIALQAPLRIDLAHEAPLQLGPIRVEPALRRLAHRDGREEIVEPRVMQVLVVLGRSPGRIFTRDDLLAACWRGVIVGEDALTRIIGRLRRLSEEIAADAFAIETITKVGYRLLPVDLHGGESEPERSSADAPPPLAERPGQPVRRPADAPAAEPLLAVLPFDNLSADKEMSFFSDGVAEEIQQALARSPGLRLIARSSAFQFRGADKSVRNVAIQLGVSHLLDGSVRRSGERVRIGAQLVECESGVALWSDRFDGQLHDIFALQDEIAASVARALEVVLRPAPTVPAMGMATYECFLKAQSIISEGGRLFDESGAAAAPLLEQVVREAPAHARAWELLAEARAWTLRSGHRSQSYEVGWAGVTEAAQAALGLDPACGGAYEALAMLEPWGAYLRRETLLERALDVSHNEPGVLTSMSTFCWSVGRIRDSLNFAERACVRNPLFPAARLAVAQMQGYMGAYDLSLRLHDEIRRRWPDNYAVLQSTLNFACTLGFWSYFDEAAAQIGRFSGSQREQLEAAVKYGENLRNPDPSPRLAQLERVRARVATTGTLALNRLAQLCVYGFEAEALQLAEKASFAHVFDPDGPLPGSIFPGVLFGPWSSFNRNPRFMQLCQRLGLCDYWVQSGRWPDCAGHLPYDFKGEAQRVCGSSS